MHYKFNFTNLFLFCTHQEACTLVGLQNPGAVGTFLNANASSLFNNRVLLALGIPDPLVVIASATWYAQPLIDEKNQSSGSRGVRIRFALPSLQIVGVRIRRKRLGKSASPCGQPDTTLTPVGESESTGQIVLTQAQVQALLRAAGIGPLEMAEEDNEAEDP